MKTLLLTTALLGLTACGARVVEPICDREAQIWNKFDTSEDNCAKPTVPVAPASDHDGGGNPGNPGDGPGDGHGNGHGGDHGNNGHGNDKDGNDDSNPGHSNDPDDDTDDDGSPGNSGNHGNRNR